MPAFRRRLVALAVAVAAGLGILPVSTPSVRAYPSDRVALEGHGWGHGRGMGQYGALGYALAGWDWHRILGHYYSNTSMGDIGAGAVASVRLLRFDNVGSMIFVQPNGAAGVNGSGAYRAVMVQRWGANFFKVFASQGCAGEGGWGLVRELNGPVRLTAPNNGDGNTLLHTCEGSNRIYRGDMYVVDAPADANYPNRPAGPRLVNVLLLDDYLRGVVPSESPAGWGSITSAHGTGMNALRAQAVAARSYARAENRWPAYAGTCDTEACQVYHGYLHEHPNTNRAIDETRGMVRLMPGGGVARTEFSSSTGGRTAGGTFPSVPDDGDSVCVPGACNPNHTWRVDIPVSSIEQAYPSIGRLESFGINRSPDDGVRAREVVLQGSNGRVTVGGESFRFRFGLKSTWFNVLGQPSGGVKGYWLMANDGGIFSFGYAQFHGSMGGTPLNRPVVGMARTRSGNGYWLVASDGGIFTFGDAQFHGSMGGQPLNRPIVGMAPTPSGNGYWLVASDGGIFSFGDAQFLGSMGGTPLNRPVVGMAPTVNGNGYWLVASDGGIFSFGHAQFHGSTGGIALHRPVMGMAARPDDGGYWLVAQDGGVFAFNAPFHGSLPARGIVSTAVAMRPTMTSGGYLIVTEDGRVHSFGDAPWFGGMPEAIPAWRGRIISMEVTPG